VGSAGETDKSRDGGSAVATVLLAVTLVVVIPYLAWSMRQRREA